MPVVNLSLEPVFPTGEGPCSWPVDVLCSEEEWAAFSQEVQGAAIAWSTYILWALTGRRYGPCSLTVRPCGPKCMGPTGYLTFPVTTNGALSGAGMPWMIPWIDNGVWRNCGCAGPCTCAARCQVALPGPVAAVNEVKVDGLVISPTAYRLDVVRGIPVLVRTDGLCWPECQDMNQDINETGSFAITYQRGIAVPRAGQLAAGELAVEFAKACAGQDCALPAQLASLSRNGVEVQVADPTAVLESGLTGIPNVDLWIRAVNPYRRPARSRVMSADLPASRITA